MSDQKPKKKAIKPTNEELEKRIEDAEFLIARGAKRSQLHKTLCAKYNIDWRTVDRYCSRARQNWAKRVAKSKADHIGDTFATLENIILTAKDTKHVLGAVKQKRELLALDAPKRIEVTGADGEPVKIDLSVALAKAYGPQIE